MLYPQSSRSCLKIRSSRFDTVRNVQMSKRREFVIVVGERRRGIFFLMGQNRNRPVSDRLFVRKLPRSSRSNFLHEKSQKSKWTGNARTDCTQCPAHIPIYCRLYIDVCVEGMGIVGGWAIGVNKKGEYPSSSFISSPFYGYLLRSHRMPCSRGQAKAD